MSTASPTRATPSPAVHEAKARIAEQQSRDLSVGYSARVFTSQFADGALPDELAELRAARDSYFLLARSYRAAARRVERVRRIRRLLAQVVRLLRRGGDR